MDLNGRLHFTARDAAHGRELWTSAGTASSTRLVRDIRRGPRDSGPHELTAVGRRLFFSAGDAHGRELWVHEP
ncbi:hypothetical protein BH23CHL8_BH23CHL8_07450 [soil metagenome]